MNNTNAEDVKIHAVSPALTAIVAAAAAAAGFANALKLSAAVVATNASLDLFLGDLTTLDCSISVTKALASDVSSFSNEKDEEEELDIETATARRPLFFSSHPLFKEVKNTRALFLCISKGRFSPPFWKCAFFEKEDARVVVVRFAGSIDEDVFWMEFIVIMVTIYSSVSSSQSVLSVRSLKRQTN
jgi:hypothetical protein